MVIQTKLSKNSFENRLKTMTTPYKHWNFDYKDKNCYVLKQKKDNFRIGYHVPYVWNTDGYWCEYLYGKYVVNDDGYVVINYRFGKPLFIIIPFIVLLIMCLPIFLYLLYDVIINGIFDIAIFISGIFSIIGAVGLFGKSKKTRHSYLTLLQKICKVK